MDRPIAHGKQDTSAQHAAFSLKIGERAELSADVSVTAIGLLSIGALVSSILLSSAVIVRVAMRGRFVDRRPS